MKIIKVVLAPLIILTLIITIFCSLYRVENAEVVEVYGDDVIFVTSDGNEWEFVESGYKVGDKIKVSFNCKGTEKREDDVIIKVK